MDKFVVNLFLNITFTVDILDITVILKKQWVQGRGEGQCGSIELVLVSSS